MIFEFDMVYRSLFVSFLKFGKVVNMIVCDNLVEPLKGSLYLQYDNEKSAERCRKDMSDRPYDGRPMNPLFLSTHDISSLVCPYHLLKNCVGSDE